MFNTKKNGLYLVRFYDIVNIENELMGVESAKYEIVGCVGDELDEEITTALYLKDNHQDDSYMIMLFKDNEVKRCENMLFDNGENGNMMFGLIVVNIILEYVQVWHLIRI